MDTQLSALERTIHAGANVLTDKHAALLALCRELARQMDGAGPDAPSTRLSAAYLSALKDLARVLAVKDQAARHGKLAQLRSMQGGTTKRDVHTRGSKKASGT